MILNINLILITILIFIIIFVLRMILNIISLSDNDYQNHLAFES